MALPRAELAHRSWFWHLHGWLAGRLAPPRTLTRYRGFSGASYWSFTGALAAGLGLGLYVLVLTGRFWQADFAFTVGWSIFAVFGVVFLIWPFLMSYYMYLPLRSILHTRTRAACYGALWHLLAHAMVLRAMGSTALTWGAMIPLLVGALWGSWLPAAAPAESAETERV